MEKITVHEKERVFQEIRSLQSFKSFIVVKEKRLLDALVNADNDYFKQLQGRVLELRELIKTIDTPN